MKQSFPMFCFSLFLTTNSIYTFLMNKPSRPPGGRSAYSKDPGPFFQRKLTLLMLCCCLFWHLAADLPAVRAGLWSVAFVCDGVAASGFRGFFFLFRFPSPGGGDPGPAHDFPAGCRLLFQCHAQLFLNIVQPAQFFRRVQGNGDAVFAGAACTAYPVHIPGS